MLERLKNDLATRHIPVCVISTDDARDRALSAGAIAFVAKPIQSRDVLDQLLDSVTAFITRHDSPVARRRAGPDAPRSDWWST